jgi:asparagine synthase (glutamine-hydrolysing)
MPRLHGKHLLRTLAAKRLPAGLSRLPKKGFTAPVGAWLAGPYGDRFRDEVLAPGAAIRSLLDVGQLRVWFDEHSSQHRDHWYPLWAAWMLERWSVANSRWRKGR